MVGLSFGVFTTTEAKELAVTRTPACKRDLRGHLRVSGT